MSERADASLNGPDEPHLDGLEDVVRARLSGRARWLRASLLVALVVAVAAGLAWRSTTPRETARPASVLVASNVSYGTVTLNGHTQRGPLPTVITLRTGKNTVSFAAAPFAPVSCVVVWPQAITSAATAGCSLSTLSPAQNVVVSGKRVAIGGEMTFSMGGSALPSAECASALAAVVTSLNALALTTIVPAGQHIATGDASGQQVPFDRISPSGLYARLTPRVADYADRRCDRLSAGAPQLTPPDLTRIATIWNVFVPVTEDLSFVRLDGSTPRPSASIEGVVQVNLVAPSGRGAWRVAVVAPTLDRQIEENFCGSGSQDLAAIYHLAYPNGNVANFSAHTNPRSSHGIEGCWLELDVAADNWATKANYLWRFGVLLATDSASHNLLPVLPSASAAELATVPLDP